MKYLSVVGFAVFLASVCIQAQDCLGVMTIRSTNLLAKPNPSGEVVLSIPANKALVFYLKSVFFPHIIESNYFVCFPVQNGNYYHVFATGSQKAGWLPVQDVVLVPCNSLIDTTDSIRRPDLASLYANAIKLMSDRRSESLARDYGFEIISPSVNHQPVLEKPDYTVEFGMAGNALGLKITNHAQGPIKILWSECALILPSGQSASIMHKGVKFANRDQQMPPTVIPPGAYIDDIMAPASSVTWTDAGWVSAPMFGIGQNPKGQEFGAMLAIQVGDKAVYETVRLRVVETSNQH
jgi:hypothetical protein